MSRSLFKIEIEMLAENLPALIERLEDLFEDEPVVIHPVGRQYYTGVPGIFCEGCEGYTIPGVRWPTAANSDGSKPWVERCDTCQRYDSDEAAADRVVEEYEYDAGQEVIRGTATPAGSATPTPWVALPGYYPDLPERTEDDQ